MDDSITQATVKKGTQLHNELHQLCIDLTILVNKSIEKTISNQDSYESSKKIFNSFVNLINEFEPCPKLLDQHLTNYIEVLSSLYLTLYSTVESHTSNFLTNGIGEVVYNFSKIRGFKHITNYFSSDVYLVPRLIGLIEILDNDNEVFLCLIWLSNLVLVPFKLDEIDPMLTGNLYNVGLINLSKHYNASKNQLVSSILLSRLLTRPDLLSGSNTLLEDYLHKKAEPEWSHIDRVNGSIKLGHLITINKLLKRCPIEHLQMELGSIYKMITADLINLRYQQEHNTNELNNLNILYMIKILSRLSSLYMKNEDYAMLTNIINNLLNDIFKIMTNKFDTTLRYAIAKSWSLITSNLSQYANNYQEQLVLYLVDQLNIPNLDGTFQNYLPINSDEISIPKYHTILLYLGYVCLNKSLPIHLIPLTLSIVHKTLFIDQRRLSVTIGSQVRDSSCFILWALCRMINQDQFGKLLIENTYMMENILFDLILTAIMDSELIIRRCSVAVIQEFIGRFGTILFKSHLQDPEALGGFTIRFIELFDGTSISSNIQSYELIKSLISLGFDKQLFIPIMVKHISNSDKQFEDVKLNSKYIRDILKEDGNSSLRTAIDLRLSETPLKKFTATEISKILLEQDSLLLYSICEMQLVEYDPSVIYSVQERLKGFNFDFHFDSIDIAEGYIKWISLLNRSKNTENSYWTNVFNILRMQGTTGLIEEFKVFFSCLPKGGIDQNNTRKFSLYLKSNNVILSKVIFYYKFFNQDEMAEIMKSIGNTSLDADIRANLVHCLSDNYPILQKTYRLSIIALLDDYTTTNQGDVGSKVRLASIKLIEKNIGHFKDEYPEINFKLVRLAGELIDKIRFGSFKLLAQLNGGMTTNIEASSFRQYFRLLFDYYREHVTSNSELAIQFWKGISFTIGALTANPMILNDSFQELRVFIDSCEGSEQELILQYLLTVLKQPPTSARDSKAYIMVLNVLVKLFESNFLFPGGFNYNTLYIRCYNLQINTTNVIRIGLTLKLMSFISLYAEKSLQVKSRLRLVQLALSHKLESVRWLCNDALFEIINESKGSEAAKSLDIINWGKSPTELKGYKETLEDLVRV